MKPIIFKSSQHDEQFFKELNTRVTTYFKENSISRHGNVNLHIKAVILIGLYLLTWVSILVVESIGMLYLLYAILGMLTIFVALNVAHDAAHATFSSSSRVNNILLYTFDFLGASGYMWKLKHVHSHHPHVNIPNMDGDIKQSNLVRIFPNAPHLNLHKYQYLYMPLLYAFYTLVWLCLRDFKDYFYTDISGKPDIKHPRIEYVKLIVGKLCFVGRMIVLPYMLLPFTLPQILLGFFIFHLGASYTVAMALISAHVGEHSVYPAPDDNGQMHQSWVRHQIVTTCDFATQSSVITHLFGGFNHHIVHHLFPKISHIHYPALTEILVETCQEYDMPYSVNPTLFDALISHLKFLKIRSRRGEQVPYIEM